MVLVDTSVLINYLKNVEDEYSNALNILIENHYPIGINNFIYMEILQGAKSPKEYEILKKYLSQFHFYALKDDSSYEKAALLKVVCKNKGITVRSTIDLLIVQTAIDNEVMLLANDSDFYNMAKAVSDLKMFEV